MIMRLSALSLSAVIICQAHYPGTERPAGWAYRTIDGRACWYEGPKMLPKHRLRWRPTDPEYFIPMRVEPEGSFGWRWIDPSGWTHQE
jgi:hypothetical protein